MNPTNPPTRAPTAVELLADPIVQSAMDQAWLDLELRPEGWHVDYELTKPFTAGGGPHYLIDSQTGVILSKRYEQ
jgi:hypothetical protein